MATCIAQVHKDADSAFGLTFVDFPGCVASAETLQALAHAGAEALALHVQGMIEDGDAIPAPTGLDAHAAAAGAGEPQLPILLIEVATTPARAVRVNVTLPEDVLRDIDRVTGNRSRFLAEAARAKLRAA